MPLHVSSTLAHRQEAKIVLYSLWYHQTETSEWSKITKITKITKIKFYKYEHIVVKYIEMHGQQNIKKCFRRFSVHHQELKTAHTDRYCTCC